MAVDLVTNGLLSEAKANDVRQRAVSNGETFFRTLIRDHTVRNHRQIYEWVANHLGCELITETESLLPMIRGVPWLSHGVAERRGKAHALLLGALGETFVGFELTCEPDIEFGEPVGKGPLVVREIAERRREEVRIRAACDNMYPCFRTDEVAI